VEENITLSCFAKNGKIGDGKIEDTVNFGTTSPSMARYHLAYVGLFSDCHGQENAANIFFLAPKHRLCAAAYSYHPWIDRHRLAFRSILVIIMRGAKNA